jgi:hypothetical protein
LFALLWIGKSGKGLQPVPQLWDFGNADCLDQQLTTRNGLDHLMPSTRFTPRTTASAVLLLLLGVLSTVVRAQTPNLANPVPAESFAGEQFCYHLDLSNSGNPGYGPEIRLLLPPDLSFDSAQFLGTGVNPTTVGVFPAMPGNQLTDPLSNSVVTGPPGGAARYC